MPEWTRHSSGHGWRVTPTGIEVEGEGLTYTHGAPESVRGLWSDFREYFLAGAQAFGLDVATLVALAAIEATCLPGSFRRDPACVRQEPGYISDVRTPQRVSVGLMQTLISTARGVAPWCGYAKNTVTREFLKVPGHSILCGAATVRSGWWQHHGDPVLVQAAYNAGGVYPTTRNRWHLMTYQADRTDRFIEYYNDFRRAGLV